VLEEPTTLTASASPLVCSVAKGGCVCRRLRESHCDVASQTGSTTGPTHVLLDSPVAGPQQSQAARDGPPERPRPPVRAVSGQIYGPNWTYRSQSNLRVGVGGKHASALGSTTSACLTERSVVYWRYCSRLEHSRRGSGRIRPLAPVVSGEMRVASSRSNRPSVAYSVV